MASTRRAGFTLVELMLALTLTAIAAGVAGTTLAAARRTGERVTAHSQDSAADVRLRAVLTDMLRHAPAGERVSDPLLEILAEGESPRLEFLTTGVQSPLGTGPVWRATLMVDSAGLHLRAVPLGDQRDSAALTLTIADADGLRVDVLEPARPGEAATWRSDWPVRQMRPDAMRVSWRQHGQEREPLVVALRPLVMDGSTP